MRQQKWWVTPGVLGQSYTTQDELKKVIQGICNNATLDQPMDIGLQILMIDLLQHHHEWTAKAGVGIKHLEVRINFGGYKPTRGIWIVRTDASEIDISWTTVFKPGGGASVKDNTAAAARREVMAQIVAVRAEQEGGECPICGELLVTDLHVDHCPPITFDSLLAQWLARRKLSYGDIQIDDKGIIALFVDRALAADWQNYHETHAQLRLIHAHENLTLPRIAVVA